MSSLEQPKSYEHVLRQLAAFMDMHNLPGTIQVDVERPQRTRAAPEVSVLVSNQKEMDRWKRTSLDYQVTTDSYGFEEISSDRTTSPYVVLEGNIAEPSSRNPAWLTPVSPGWILRVRRNCLQDGFAAVDVCGSIPLHRLH